MMNPLGRDGWELASAFSANVGYGNTRDVVVIFKGKRDDGFSPGARAFNAMELFRFHWKSQ